MLLRFHQIDVYKPFYERQFYINKLTSRRNDDVYRRLRWIVESDYFQTLLARRPSNDDPEVIDLIR